MHIFEKKSDRLVIEEIAVPERRRKFYKLPWQEWIQKNAPGHTSWVMYEIDIENGSILKYYSFTKKGWYQISESDCIISKLLNLRFDKIPDSMRKRIGMKTPKENDLRPLWQPALTMDGQIVNGVKFDGWSAKWVNDGSDLSGKIIEIYTPQENTKYPSYFPYWLQVCGSITNAKILIIDSGTNLKSPKPSLDSMIINQKTII